MSCRNASARDTSRTVTPVGPPTRRGNRKHLSGVQSCIAMLTGTMPVRPSTVVRTSLAGIDSASARALSRKRNSSGPRGATRYALRHHGRQHVVTDQRRTR